MTPRRRVGLAALLAAVGALVLAREAAAQFGAEARVGYAIGSHTATEAGLEWKPRATREVRLRRSFGFLMALSAGYVQTEFGCGDGFCQGSDLGVTGSHAVVGAEVTLGPLWARAGVLYGTMRVGTGGEDPVAGLGADAGGGLRIGFGPLSLGPGVTFRRFAADTPSEPATAYAIGVDFGAVLNFD